MIKDLEKLSINEIEDLIKELEQKRINLKIMKIIYWGYYI